MNKKFEEYFASLKGKKVTVIGLGISNTPLVELLLQAGSHVTVCDKSERSKFSNLADTWEEKGVELQLGEHYLDGIEGDIIFRTPGLRPDTLQLEQAKKAGAEVTSEMEAFFKVCPCKIIAVTGSDGKTTTTTIISELLKKVGYNVHLGGNIGKPLLADAKDMSESDIAVLELSSFQLMDIRYSPDIAVITNISPNHLDYHKDYDEYINSKKNIFAHQNSGGKLILNADNPITAAIGTEARGEVHFFSRNIKVQNGVYESDNVIYSVHNVSASKIMNSDEILLPGVHNIENYMAAFAAVDGLVEPEIMRETAISFTGVEHRIELVRVLNGVSYYNDSIASSPTRTIAGLKSFKQKVILIAGGYDKKIPFDVLGPEIIDHVKVLVLTGATAEKIRASVESAANYSEGTPVIIEKDDFDAAVHAATASAQNGDIVILSPACASFDRFKNFAERGNRFKSIVLEL